MGNPALAWTKAQEFSVRFQVLTAASMKIALMTEAVSASETSVNFY
jgi:hypothetical protein